MLRGIRASTCRETASAPLFVQGRATGRYPRKFASQLSIAQGVSRKQRKGEDRSPCTVAIYWPGDGWKQKRADCTAVALPGTSCVQDYDDVGLKVVSWNAHNAPLDFPTPLNPCYVRGRLPRLGVWHLRRTTFTGLVAHGVCMLEPRLMMTERRSNRTAQITRVGHVAELDEIHR